MEQAELQARPHGELISELLDSRIPKNEREHAAAREIERLAEALEEIRSRSCMNLAMNPNPHEITAMLGYIHQIADAALGGEAYKVRDSYWLPIETAPKDGSLIQLYRPTQLFIGYYGGPDSGWRHKAPGLPEIFPSPTHWLPLPDAPKSEK